MRLPNLRNSARRHGPVLGALALIVAMNGCGLGGLEEVKVPPLVGPSETGISLEMRASPDTLNADGVSQSVVRIQVRDQNGKPAAGRQLAVRLAQGDGFLVAGSLVVGPLQTAASLATDSGGVAQVVYTAGFSPGLLVVIAVKPYSFDATPEPLQQERVVAIFQQ
jgi:invasin-like protein